MELRKRCERKKKIIIQTENKNVNTYNIMTYRANFLTHFYTRFVSITFVQQAIATASMCYGSLCANVPRGSNNNNYIRYLLVPLM